MSESLINGQDVLVLTTIDLIDSNGKIWLNETDRAWGWPLDDAAVQRMAKAAFFACNPWELPSTWDNDIEGEEELRERWRDGIRAAVGALINPAPDAS